MLDMKITLAERPLRVVHLEDNISDRLLINLMLKKEGLNCEIVYANSKSEFEGALKQGEFDFILSDFSIPSYDGMKALAAARTMKPETPFLFVSGTIGEERAVEGLKSGATDYILKDRLERLGLAIRRALQDGAERSRRKAAEETLKKTQERLSSVLAKSPAIIYVLHVEGKTLKPVWVSENIEPLLGYTAQEVCQIGRWDSCIHPEDREFVARDTEKLFSINHTVREYRVKKQDGDYRWISDEQRLVRDASGNPAEVVGSWTEITERKQLEEQLRQSQKMEAIGQLAGGVAHDFNNLLTVIRGNAELLMMSTGQFDGESKDWLNQVVSASDRAAGLTRQLLVFGRKQMMRPKPLRLDATVTDMAKMLGRLIGANIKLKCQHADPLPFIHADPGMMEQVIMNLVLNARDAMSTGGKLTIMTEPVWLDEPRTKEPGKGRPGEFVRLSVSDTGCGIPPAILGRIFEPFFTTKDIGKGTGLGLSTVYGIVEQHQGWIEVKSDVGSGTTFETFFPSVSTLTDQAHEGVGEATPRGGNEHILLVEDDEPVRLFTAQTLRKMGYQVLEADCGKAALKLWKENNRNTDILLTDIIMPDVTGWELARSLYFQKRNLRMVFMSGYSPEAFEKENEFLREDGIHFLQKPYSSQALLHTIRECLDKQSVHAI